METRETIEECVDYAVNEFIGQMYYEDIDIELFKEALKDGIITVDEIVDRFKTELQTHL